MSVDIEVESTRVDGDGRRSSAPGRTLPNVSGDLPTVLAAAPMFRRAVAGYDRFQVESYVQWAEDELAAADRERERLLTRQLETVSALEEARELLSHSAGGGEFLRVSRQIGALLASAADEAEAVRDEAVAERAAAEEERRTAKAEADRLIAEARRRASATETLADRSLAAARAEAAAMIEQAQGIVATAQQDAARLRAAGEERLAAARQQEQGAAAEADRIRAQAAEEAAGARLQARGEILRMLAAGREERRRADAVAEAARLSSPAAR